MSTARWGGRRAQQWTRQVLATYGYMCHLRLPGCTAVATTGDHLVPRSVDVTREYDVTNGRPACEACNKRRKASPLVAIIDLDARVFFESAALSGRSPTQSPPRDTTKIDGSSPKEGGR